MECGGVRQAGSRGLSPEEGTEGSCRAQGRCLLSFLEL